MARKVQVILEDDLDGTELGTDGETVTFALDGTTYEIDLSDKNAKSLRDTFGRYVQHARKAGRASSGGHSSRRGATGGSGHGSETKAARAWLVEHGHLGPDSRGRIKGDLWELYRNRGQQSIPAETTEAAETGVTAEATQTESKPPRRNSKKADKAEAGTETTPDVSAVASLLP